MNTFNLKKKRRMRILSARIFIFGGKNNIFKQSIYN